MCFNETEIHLNSDKYREKKNKMRLKPTMYLVISNISCHGIKTCTNWVYLNTKKHVLRNTSMISVVTLAPFTNNQ